MEPSRINLYPASHRAGVSIVEAMLAVVIFGMFATTFASAVIYAPQVTADSGQRMRATYVAETGLAAIDSIKQNNWSELAAMQTGVQLVDNVWALSGPDTSDTIGDYTRQITLTEVCRDATNAIAACPADRTDPNTFQVAVSVNWVSRYGLQRSVSATKLITNWESSQFTQTDWAGGPDQVIWSNETQYDSDDENLDVTTTPGQVSLAAGAGGGITGKGCGPKVYNFDTPAQYTTSGSEITLSSGTAALTNIGDASVDANTVGLWHVNDAASPLVSATGANNLTQVGNAFVYSATGKFGTSIGSGDGTGDYWQIADGSQVGLESFTAFTLEGWYKTGSSVNAGVDTLIAKYGSTTAARSYALSWNNGVNGSANIQFGIGNGTSDLVLTSSQFGIAANTWYHLAAVYDGANMRIYLNGSNVGSRTFGGTIANSSAAFALGGNPTSASLSLAVGARIDELRVSNIARYNANFTPQTRPYGPAYSEAKPTVQPTAAYDPVVADRWQSFTEVATKAGSAQIYYQLSDDGGATWKWWNGSAWATVVAATDYNTAATINTNIPTFPVANSQLLWRAFFVSNGSDNISLDTVTVTCVQTENIDYATPAQYTATSGAEVSSGAARLAASGTATDVNTVGLWHFNETAAPYLDYSGSGNPITNYGNFIFTPAQTGKFNYGILGSLTSYAAIAFGSQNNLNLSNTDFTFDFWINKVTYSTTSEIIKKWTGATAGNAYRVYINSTGKVVFEVANGSGTTATLIGTTTIPLSTWTHVTVVFDDLPATDGSGFNSYMYIYVNGVYDTSRGTIYTSLINPAGDIVIGGVGTTGPRGILDELRISNTARSTVTSGTAFAAPTEPYGLYYNSTSPTVVNTTAISAPDIVNWQLFTETKTIQNNATVTYQLSNDGSNWQYWNGSAWATASSSAQTNAASVINTNIPTFSITGNTIYVRTFLTSNGSDAASVDNIEIAYVQNPEADVTVPGEGGGGGEGAAASGFLVSSAFDMERVSDVLSIDWDEVLPETCDPVEACDVKLQIRTAPDNAGAPGTWTSWFGPELADTFFDDNQITVTPDDLNGNRWLQYRLELVSDGTNSPIVEEVRIRYQ